MTGKRVQRVGAILLIVVLLWYAGYQFYLSGHRNIVTELAMYGTVSDVIQARGYVIRSEQVVSDSYSGVLDYRVSDGAKVATRGVIADVFYDESDAAAQNRIRQLDREIEVLEELSRPTDLFSVTPAMVNTQIYMNMDDLLEGARNNDFSGLSGLKEDLLLALNRKRLIIGEETADDYAVRISQLTAERDSLRASAGQAVRSITAPRAGYFISSVDGLEDSVDISEVKDLSPVEINRLLEREPTDAAGLGKICSEFNWYVACVVPDAEMWRFEGVDDVELSIPFASSETIPAAVAAINHDKATGTNAVILECSYMDAGLAQARNADVLINVHTYSGVLVRESALRFCDVTYYEYDENDEPIEKVAENVKGVYVLNGRQLEFVQVFTQRTVNGYAICKTELEEEEQAQLVTDHTVRLYDNVVTEGTDLYDGKPI